VPKRHEEVSVERVPDYRALKADERTWERAHRPKRCLLAKNSRLRNVVAKKLKEDWSPQQISGWLYRRYYDDGAMRVSHETIYRTLFVQTRCAVSRCKRPDRGLSSEQDASLGKPEPAEWLPA
jgi:IS30 family transposase